MTKHIGIHNDSESLNLKASYFEIIDTIQSEFSHRYSEFDMSLIKSLRVLSNCFPCATVLIIWQLIPT